MNDRRPSPAARPALLGAAMLAAVAVAVAGAWTGCGCWDAAPASAWDILGWGEEAGPPAAQLQLQLLPQAHAHNGRFFAHNINGYITGPHKVELFYFESVMPNIRSLISNPTISDGHARPITGYRTNAGPHALEPWTSWTAYRNDDNHHVLTVGGAAMATDATGHLTIRDGRHTVSRGSAYQADHYHQFVGGRNHENRNIPLHDRQPPALDYSLTPTLDLSAGTFKFRATENLVHGPGGAAPERIRLAGLGQPSASSTVTIRGADVTVHLSPATHEEFDRTIKSRSPQPTGTTMKIDSLNVRDATTHHDRTSHNHHGYDFSTGRWWQSVAIVRDTAPPVLDGNPRLDFNTGVLTVTFDEPVQSFWMPYLYLEDRRGGDHQHVSGATYPRPLDSATVPITLSQSQLERLGSMYRSAGGLRADLLGGITTDILGNRFVAVHNRDIHVDRDTTPPALAAGSPPGVSLARHTVTLTFNERMDASETRPGLVRLLNSSNHAVALAGATVRDVDGHSVTLSVSRTTKGNIAEMGTPLRASFAAGAFKDAWGNAAAALPAPAPATVGADWTRPGVRGSPSLDMNDGVLTIEYWDVIYTDRLDMGGHALHVADPSSPGQRTRIAMTGAEVATPGTYADEIDIRLTGAQKAAVVSAGGPSPDVRVTIAGWAYRDYPAANHGWYAYGSGLAVSTTNDTTRPLNVGMPVLDLEGGAVSLRFDEYIDASAFNPRGMLVWHDGVGGNGSGSTIRLDNSTLSPAADGSLVTANMSAAAAAEIRESYEHGDYLGLTVPATAFSDMSGNMFAGLENVSMRIVGTNTTTRLELDRAPTLDLGDGTLEFAFNINATVPSDLSGIAVASPDGAVRVGLAGAEARDAGQSMRSATVELSQRQKAQLAAAYVGESGGALAVDIAHGVFEDASGHGLAAVRNRTLDVSPDAASPVLTAGPTTDLRAGTVSMSFDEYIDLGRVVPAGFLFHSNGRAVAGLAGATVSSPDGEAYGGTLVLGMTPLQSLQVIRAAIGGDVYLNVSGSAVYDVSGRAYGGIDTSAGGNSDSAMGAAADPFASAPRQPQHVPSKGAGAALGADSKMQPPPAEGERQPAGPQPLEVGITLGPPPQLAAVPSPVRLDLGAGVLEIEFDQVVDLSATNLTGAAIRGADISVGLEGAEAPVHDPFGLNATVIVGLTAAQKAGAVAAGPAALLDLPEGFARLLDPSVAVSGARIAVAADTAPPALDLDRTVLDLGAGRLAVAYDEHVAGPPGGLDAGAFAITAAGGAGGAGGRIPLAGASAIAAANDTVVVALAPSQKARLDAAASANATLRLEAAAGAAFDLSGNPAGRAAGAALAAARDAAPPGLAGSPILNLGTGGLTLEFGEFVAADALAPQAVAVTDRDGNAAQSPSLAASSSSGSGGGGEDDADGTRLALSFSPAQAASLRAANASAGPLRISVAPNSGIADLSGNAFAGIPAGDNNGTLSVVDDSTPPAILPETSPALDIGTGVLSIMFDEHIPAGGIDLSGAAIEDAGGASRVPLSGATVVPPSGPEVEYRTMEDDTLRIFLTAAQKGAVARAHVEAGPVRLDLPSSAVSDAAGLRFVGLSNAPLSITEDAVRPALPDRALPSLDIAHGLLTVPFDEYVDAAGADPAGIELSGSPPGAASNASVPLAGAELASELDGAELRVRVSPSQLAALVGGGLTGIPPSVYLTVADGAVRDVSGNAFAGLDRMLIEALADEAPPALASLPVIDLDDGAVVVTFDEYVASTSLNASGISLVGDGSAAAPGGAPGAGGPSLVRLDGAAVSAYGPSVPIAGGGLASQSVLVKMTADQKAAAVLAAASEIDIDGHAAGLADLSGNAYGGIERGLAAVVPDETGPDADAPGSSRTATLDMSTGALEIPFDEHVDAASIDPSRIVVAVSSNSTSAPVPPPSAVRIGLAGALPSASAYPPAPEQPAQGPAAYVALTPAQRAAVQVALDAHGGLPSASVSVDMARGAAADLTGNEMPAARGLPAGAMPDGAGPSLAPPAAAAAAAGHSPAALDLARGTLAVELGEHASPQDARPERLSLSGPGGTPVPLAGASFSSISPSAILEIRLTAEQADAARALRNETTSNRVTLVQTSPGAFVDLAGNPSGADLTPPAGLLVSVAPDAGPATIGLLSASLDLASGTAALEFDSNVTVPAVDLSGIAVMGSDRTGGSTPLSGASASPQQPASGPDASLVAINLTAAQKASIVGSYRATGSEGATIDIAPSAVRNMHYRAFEGVAAHQMNLTIDRRPPVLSAATVDLAAGTVLVQFDEFVDPLTASAAAVSVSPAPSAGPAPSSSVGLAGARVLTLGASQSLLLAMTPDQKAAASLLLDASGAGSLSVSAAAGAVDDLSDNALEASSVEARVVHDTSPPSLDVQRAPPVLDLGAGTLTLSFDEHVRAASTPTSPSVSLSAASPGAHQVRLSGSQQEEQQQQGDDGDPSTVTLILTPDQKGALISGGGGSAAGAEAARLFLDAGAFADLAGNPSSPSRVPRISAVADAVPPALDPSHPPALDMGSGALRITFDEHVDPASADLSGLSISAPGSAAGGGGIALTNALLEPPSGGTDTLTLLLSRAEKGMLAAALGSTPPAEGAILRMAAGAFADLSGNPSAAGSFTVPAVAPDLTAPHLDRSADPLLNLGPDPPVLEFDFDEHVDLSAVNLSLAALRASAPGQNGTATIPLAGASVLPPPAAAAGDYRVRVALAADQAAAVAAALGGPGARLPALGASLSIDAASGAFADLAGNRLAALGGHAVLIARDADAPILVSSPRLDLDGRSLVLEFGEPVRLSTPGDASAMEIAGAGGSHPFSLGGGSGAGVATPPGSSYASAIDVRLDARQAERAKLALLADGELVVTVPAEAVHDRAYNHFEGLDGAHLFAAPDTRGPSVASASASSVLDLAHGLLTVRLDEHVDSARIDLSGAAVTVGSLPAPVGLGGAAAERSGAAAASPAEALSSPSTVLRVLLTHGQKSALSAAGTPGEPASLSLPAGALYDLAGNPSPPAEAVPLRVIPDTIPPSVDVPSILPVLDLARGTIEVHFDEAVRAAPAALGGRDGVSSAAPVPSMDIAVFDGSAGGDGRHRVPLAGHAALVPGTDGDTLAARIAPDQKAALVEAVRASALLGLGAPAVLLMEDGIVSDLSGIGLAGYGAAAGRAGGVPVAVVHDGRPPALDASRPPSLDTGSGALAVWFDEYVRADPDAAPASLTLVVGGGGGGDGQQGGAAAADPVRIPLASASLASPPGWAGSDEIAVALTHVQKAQVAAAAGLVSGTTAQMPVSLEVGAGAVSDLWGNAFPGSEAPVQVRVRADSSPPALERLPVVNTAAGTILIDLDEFADARTASASGIALAANSTAYAMLDAANSTVEAAPSGAAGLPASYSDRIVVEPDAASLEAVRGFASPSKATLNMSGMVLYDLAGIPAAALARAPITATTDTTPPSLQSATVDLADGDIRLEFNKDIDAAGAVVSQMRLAGPADAKVPLAGAALLLPNGGQHDSGVELRMSGAQKAAAAAAYSAAQQASAPLRLEAPAGAVDDEYGNHAGAINATATVEPDETRPEVLSGRLSPVLDLGAGTLTLRLSEHVDAGAVDPSGMSVRGATPAASAALAGSAVRPPAGFAGSLVLDMPAAAKAAAVQAVGARTLAGTLDIAGSASVRDASTNELGARPGIHMLVLPDRTPPVIDAPATVVDLRAGVVTIALDEHARLSSVDVSRIAVGPPLPPDGGSGAAALPPVGLGPLGAAVPAASVDGMPGGLSDRIVVRMTPNHTAAVAASLAAAPGAGASGNAALYVEPGAFADLSGNAYAGAQGLEAGATPPPVSVYSASVVGPGAAAVEYSYDRLEAGPSDYALVVDGMPRMAAAVNGSGSSAVHTLAFEPAGAPADATGTVAVAPLSGPGYVFGGAGPIAMSDGQGPSAVRAAALGQSTLSLLFDESVAGVDVSDLSVVAGADPAAVEIAAVEGGAGPARTIVLASPALAGGAGGTIAVLGGSYEDMAGNPSAPAPISLEIEPASGTVRAGGRAPVPITADLVARNVTGPSPSIDLSAVNGTFPANGDLVVTAEGPGGPAGAPLAVVTFAAGSTATVAGRAAGEPLVISVSGPNASAAAALLPDRSAVGAGELGSLVEIAAGGAAAAGAGGAAVSFDRPVRIFLPGAAGLEAFWIGGSPPLPPAGAPAAPAAARLIALQCASPTDAAAVAAQLARLGAGECAADHAGGKVIYTTHLTIFGTVAPPAPRAALPPVPGQDGASAPPAPAGLCSADPSACSYAAFDAPSVAAGEGAGGTPRLAGPAAAAASAGPAGRTILYAAGPASDPALGESIYAIDTINGSIVGELRPDSGGGHLSAMRVSDMLPGGALSAQPPGPPSAGSPPYVLASATSSILEPGSALALPPVPLLLAIDPREREVAGQAQLSYIDRLGGAAGAAVPALLGAHPGGGAAYAGMQAAAPGGGWLVDGPVLLVDTSAAPDLEVVHMYGGDGRLPSPSSGYYYPREGWQPTAMAAYGTTVYMVGAAWLQGAGTAGQGALPNSYGLHTVSFAGNESGAEEAQPRYSLVSSIEAARLPDRAADNSSYTAAGMALDPARSKLYALYSNGTLVAYALGAAQAGGPPVPSFLYHVDAAVADPRDLAIDPATGLLYAAYGGSVRVYDASRDRMVADVEVLGGPGGGIASLALDPPASGQAGPDVYAVPSSPGELPRVVRASDGAAPSVVSVRAEPGSYGAGSSVDIVVKFSRAVAVSGTPELALAIDRPSAPGARALYASGSGGSSLAFSYAVGAGDSSDGLLYANASALILPDGASISGAAEGAAGAPGAAADLSLPEPAPLAGGEAVRIDGRDSGAGVPPTPTPPPPVVVAPPAAPGSGAFFGASGGGGGGGGGSGGSGRTGVAAQADSVLIRSASWDCNAGTVKIAVAAPAASSPPDVSILSSAGMSAAELAAGSGTGGQFEYTAPLPDDAMASIQAVLVDGRAASSDSKTVRLAGQCAGEIAFDAGRGGAPAPDAAAPAPAGDVGGGDAAERQPADEPRQPDASSDPAPGASEPAAPAPAETEPAAPAPAEPEPAAPAPAAPAPAEPDPASDPGQAADGGAAAAQPPAEPPAAQTDQSAGAGGAAEDGDGRGGCLIATAAHGTELAPQVQHLREVRDSTLLTTESGRAFMAAFGAAYYSFSPQAADLEREHPALRHAVAALAAPMLHALQVVGMAEPGSESSVAAFGALAIALVAGMYVAAPAAGARYALRLCRGRSRDPRAG